jgi:hypothetical protein
VEILLWYFASLLLLNAFKTERNPFIAGLTVKNTVLEPFPFILPLLLQRKKILLVYGFILLNRRGVLR